MTNEQWKEGEEGYCSECRKRNYCSKQCANNKRKVQEEFGISFWNYLSKKAKRKENAEE